MFEWLSHIVNRLSRTERYPEQPRVSHAGRTAAGVIITPDNALKVATVWACIRYLTQTVAVLPWHVMRQDTNGTQVATTHPVDWILNERPNAEWSSFQLRETLLHWALRFGNGYAEIERDQLGRPFALWPIHPERVTVCRDPDTGALLYEVRNDGGEKIEIPFMDMFHLRGFGETVVGVNVIDYAAQSIGWASAAQLFGSSFFGSGSNFSAVIVNKSPISPDGLRLQKEEFNQKLGGLRNAHKVYHMGGDGDVKRISLNAEETQLVEVHQFLVEEICRWFGVPPHKVMHLLRATFSNIEHQAIEVVVDSVSPWVKRFETEANFKLFQGRNRMGFYTKMNMRALLRGDFKSQNEGLQIARNAGVINADEWREFLDLNKIPAGEGGDKYITQSNQTTLEQIGEQPEVDAGAGDQGDEDADAAADVAPEEAVALLNGIAEALTAEPAHAG